jgi:hypothetical protein
MTPLQFKVALDGVDLNAVDFPLVIDDLLSQVDVTDHLSLTDVIFGFFEQHPDEDTGGPGGLVHFVETFYPAYKARLLQSLSDAPNVSAVLMTNRILNSILTRGERAQYLMALRAVVAGTRASSETRKSAHDFLEYQRQRQGYSR